MVRNERVPTEALVQAMVFCDYCGALLDFNSMLPETARKVKAHSEIVFKKVPYFEVWAQFANYAESPEKNRKHTECCRNCAPKVFDAFYKMQRPEGAIHFDTADGNVPVGPEDAERLLITDEDRPSRILAPCECMNPMRVGFN